MRGTTFGKTKSKENAFYQLTIVMPKQTVKTAIKPGTILRLKTFFFPLDKLKKKILKMNIILTAFDISSSR